MPRTVNLRVHIATLPPFIRQMFWVYYSFINLCLIGFALVTITLAGTLAGIFVFDMRPYLTTVGRRLGYYSINAVIVYLLVVYAWAAWKGGPL
jgi:hypothetical protein